MNKMIKILEKVWLTIAIAAVAMSIFAFFNSDKDKSLYLLALAGIAGLMSYVRRRQRMNIEKQEQKEIEEEKK